LAADRSLSFWAFTKIKSYFTFVQLQSPSAETGEKVSLRGEPRFVELLRRVGFEK